MVCHLLSALSLFLCHNVGMLLHLFWRKIENFQKFILRAITVHLSWQTRLLSQVLIVSVI